MLQRLLSPEFFLLALTVYFFSSLFLYLQPYAREVAQSTTVATKAVTSDQSAAWIDRSDVPKGYRLMHMRCKFADPVDSDEALTHLRYGRIPLLFIHGNAGTFDTAASLSSLLPLGKWPAMGLQAETQYTSKVGEHDSSSSIFESPPSLGMTVYSVDLNEDANIHSGNILARQAKFVAKSILFLHRRFVAYHLAASQGRRRVEDGACDSLAVVAASDDFATGGGMLHAGMTPLTFCENLWREVEAVEKRGIWVVGHSMGGIVARLSVVLAAAAATAAASTTNRGDGGARHHGLPIAGIITLNSPHQYPPVMLDSVMARWYSEIRQYWSSDASPAPPVISIHAGSMDEQVFFESTRLEEHTSSGSVVQTSTLSTGHMVDCGTLFDHNSILWSLEFMEPLAEAIWRMQRQLFAITTTTTTTAHHQNVDRNEHLQVQPIPGDLMSSSLISVFPPRKYDPEKIYRARINTSTSDVGPCDATARGQKMILVNVIETPAKLVDGAKEIVVVEEKFIVFAPIRSRGCLCFELSDSSSNQWTIHAALQSPLLQFLGGNTAQDRLTTWSLISATRLKKTAEHGRLNLLSDRSCLDESNSLFQPKGEAVAVPIATGVEFHVFRGSTVRLHPRRADVIHAALYCVIAPVDFFLEGELRFPQQSKERRTLVDQALEETVHFFRLPIYEPYLWRSYAPASNSPTSMLLICQTTPTTSSEVLGVGKPPSSTADFVTIEHVTDISFQWANILVAYESGPMLLFCSVLTMVIVGYHATVQCGDPGDSQRRSIRWGWVSAIFVNALITTYACAQLLYVPFIVSVTAAVAGCGLGLALCIVNLAIQRFALVVLQLVFAARRRKLLTLLPYIQFLVACGLAAASLTWGANGHVFCLIVCWLSVMLFLVNDGHHCLVVGLRSILSIAILITFHSSGSVFHLKNCFLGSDLVPLAPEFSECTWILLFSSIMAMILPVTFTGSLGRKTKSGNTTPREATVSHEATKSHHNGVFLHPTPFVGVANTAPLLVLALVEYAMFDVTEIHRRDFLGSSHQLKNAMLPQYWEMSRCALCATLAALAAVLDAALAQF